MPTQVIHQRFTVPFSYPVYFTRSVFSKGNQTFLKAVAPRQSDAPVRILLVVDDGAKVIPAAAEPLPSVRAVLPLPEPVKSTVSAEEGAALPVQLAAVDHAESAPRPVQARAPDAARAPTVPDNVAVKGPPCAAGTRSVTVPLKASVLMAYGERPETVRVMVRRSVESPETEVTMPAGDRLQEAGTERVEEAARLMGLEKVTESVFEEEFLRVVTAGGRRSP